MALGLENEIFLCQKWISQVDPLFRGLWTTQDVEHPNPIGFFIASIQALLLGDEGCH